MTKCKSCKSKIKKDLDFCPYCGEAQKGKDSTHLVLILDRSGSMSSVKQATIEGFNQFISDQKRVPLPATISLYQFDDIYEPVYENIDLKDVKYLSDDIYQPRNTTALFDAIGKTINGYVSHYTSLAVKERPKKVLFCVITDGYENASKEFTSKKAVRDLMDSVKKRYNWQFSFVGAGIDAYKEASGFGISRGQVMSVDCNNQGMTDLYHAHSHATVAYRGGAQSFSYNNKYSTTTKED